LDLIEIFYEIFGQNGCRTKKIYPICGRGQCICSARTGLYQSRQNKGHRVRGLAFEYIIDEVSRIEISKVDIFLRGEDFFISKIPCKVVYDIPVEASRANQPSTGLMHKRCGLAFEILPNNEKSMIEHFIEAHTTGLEPGRNKLEAQGIKKGARRKRRTSR